MRAFIIELENRPGALADISEALGQRGINITGVAGSAWDDDGAIAIITNDESGTRSVLEERDVDFREMDVVAAALDDQPGMLGTAARRLAEKGVNVQAVIPTGTSGGRVTVALAVENGDAAREALGDMALSGSSASF